MPYAVTHMLIPMILLDILRDNILKIKRKKLPNKYILIAGIAGLLPDVDIPLSLVFGSSFAVHRTITHTVWLPLTFLLFSSLFYFFKKPEWSKVLLIAAMGVTIHIILDSTISGSVALFYPLNKSPVGLSLIPLRDAPLFYSSLDAVLLFLYFLRISLRKKVQDIV